ncbi:X-linked interleukin-1 receptor accessory protein-like 2 [Labeo rohita]|uniref:X-linked interleukin-1 receptor accessory protein-like 2 n=1 Tax=Labeo rohita TaxID=84645 RepID=A0ABQ8M578_LABRO|nr:X-linked interleukin-1 receptor accessory protein-like 2 [Labeo rohita]
MRLVLDCRAFFGYSGDSRPIIYWMKGDKFVEELEGHIRESEVRSSGARTRMTITERTETSSGRNRPLSVLEEGQRSEAQSRVNIHIFACSVEFDWGDGEVCGDECVCGSCEPLDGARPYEEHDMVLREFLGEKEVELSLIFDAVEETDLGNYTCNVENHIGRSSGSAILQKKDMYRLELVGGLGAIMLILGIFTAIYKCYNVEIMLCYRRHFGSDEADDDNKEYDGYLSYTKVDLESVEREMSEEELFALEILPDTNWDLTLALEGLSGALFEPLESFTERFLTLKMVLLLALTSLKTAEISRPNHLPPPVWIFPLDWPGYVPKMPPSVMAQANQLLFCSGRWGRGSPVSEHRLSLWIVDAIALVNVSCGSWYQSEGVWPSQKLWLRVHLCMTLSFVSLSLCVSPAYIEDLARSVEQSRRLIIVLTPEFVARRGWSIFQFEPRLHSMLVTGEIKVIMIECSDLRSVINYQEVEDLKHTIRVLSLIKWHGPKSNQLKSKFWKRVRYEMPAKKRESVSRRQVLDSGEQGLFGDLQAVSTVAMTATSASLAPAHVEIPDYNEPGHLQMRHFCRSYEYELPSTAIATLSGRHVYCNLPMTLLNGRLTQNNVGKPKKDVHLNSPFVPLSGRELSSDIW